MFRLVFRLVGRDDAADVLQHVFLQVFRNIRQFAGDSRFETWLFRIAVNECLQFRRREARKSFVPLEHDPSDPSANPEGLVDQRDLLETALARLEPELRTIFLLRETEHLAYAEIAETLGIAEGTVASRLNRARRNLQKILAELGWEP